MLLGEEESENACVFPMSAEPRMARQEPDKHCDVSPWMAASDDL